MKKTLIHIFSSLLAILKHLLFQPEGKSLPGMNTISGEFESIPSVFPSQALGTFWRHLPWASFPCLQIHFRHKKSHASMKCWHFEVSAYSRLSIYVCETEGWALCAGPGILLGDTEINKGGPCISLVHGLVGEMVICAGDNWTLLGAVRLQRWGRQERETVELNLNRGLPDVRKVHSKQWKSEEVPLIAPHDSTQTLSAYVQEQLPWSWHHVCLISW